jgi:putative membrane protein
MQATGMQLVLALAQAQTWEGAGHDVDAAWLEWAGRTGAIVLAAVLLVFVVRGFLLRHRYRAVDLLSEEDIAAVHTELVAVEKRTVGEVVPVVLERSDAHPGANWLAALVTALIGCAVLAPWLPWEQPLYLLVCQVGLGAIGYGLARDLPGFRRAFIRESRATEMAQEQAVQEFYRYGLHETCEHTGVLLFVSLLEQRVIVLADQGIDERVDVDQWQRTDTAILDGIRMTSLRNGLIAGVRQAGEVLAEHFPWKEGDRNEVPDRVIVRRE